MLSCYFNLIMLFEKWNNANQTNWIYSIDNVYILYEINQMYVLFILNQYVFNSFT